MQKEGFSDAIINRFFRPFLGGIFFDNDLKVTSRLFEFVMRMLASGENSLPANGIGAIAEQMAAALPAGTIKTGSQCPKTLHPTPHAFQPDACILFLLPLIVHRMLHLTLICFGHDVNSNSTYMSISCTKCLRIRCVVHLCSAKQCLAVGQQRPTLLFEHTCAHSKLILPPVAEQHLAEGSQHSGG